MEKIGGVWNGMFEFLGVHASIQGKMANKNCPGVLACGDLG